MTINSASQKGDKKLRILIVSENSAYATSLKKVFEGNGFRANICLVADDVTNLLVTFDAHLVFVEQNLGDKSGIELIRRLKNFNPNLKCILIAAHPDLESSVEAFRQGASDFLQQPIAEEDLLLAIDRCMGHHLHKGEMDQSIDELGGRHHDIINTGKSLTETLKWMDEAQRLGQVGHWVWDEVEDRELVASRESLRVADTLHLAKSPTWDEFLEKLHPEDQERVDRELREASDTGARYECEYRIILQDGGIRYVVERGEPVFGDSGTLIQTLGTVQDVTEHREREQALRESEERYKDAAFKAKLGHWVYDEVADKLIYCSEEIARIHGMAPDEMFAKLDHSDKGIERLHPEDREEYKKGTKAAQKNPPPYDIEYRIIRPDGEIRFVRETGDPDYDRTDAMVLSHGTMQDITEQKLLHEELMNAAEKADIANHAKSEFLAMMSHEIRTPINAVLGFLDLLIETHLDEEQTKFAKSGQLSADLLLEIINDILDFVKMEAGRLDFYKERFELRNLAEAVIDVLSVRAKEKEITIEVDIEPGTPRYLEGDPGRIRQILINLANNAIKFTDVGGVKIVISSERETEKEATLRFEVTDTGIGIGKEHHDELFAEFTTLSPSYTHKFGGTGLGLAISKRLVEMMNGNIDFSSQKGKGSTFWFNITLPKSTVSEVGLKPRKPASTFGSNLSNLSGSVLLAEDNPANQMVARTMLEKAGLTVSVAKNGLEVLDAVNLRNYDLILMDVGMPKMNGIEATRAIRQLDPTVAKIPIIAMTAHVMSGDRESLLNQGIDDYLSKPCSKKDLLKMVHKWLNVENNDLRFPSAQENHNKFGNQNIALETIDHNTLIQLGEDTDPGMLPTLIDAFIANINDRMAAINQAVSALDMRQLAEDAHSLKGSSATFGVVSLNRLAAELEIAARKEDLAFIRLNSHRIADECEATKIGLRKFLEGHRGTSN